MSGPRRYLTSQQVVDELGLKSLDWFYRHVKGMRKRGFPKPVPGMGYDPLAIEAWQDMELLGCFAQPRTRDLDENLADAEARALERV